jgi:RNA polymerase sigma-70 factor (ECF subfamily)
MMSIKINDNLEYVNIEKKLTGSMDVTYILNCCRVLGSSELKLTFLFSNILKIDRANAAKLLSAGSDAAAVLVSKMQEILFYELSILDLENLENTDSEISVLTDLFFELFNKINYSSDLEQGFKKSFVLKIISFFKLIIEAHSTNKHAVHALLAYLYFNLSRQDTIFSDEGKIISLREQDRSKWDTESIKKGLFHLGKSADGKNVTIYHLESAIAAIHCLAKSYKQTDWYKILFVYDKYLSIKQSPYVELQKATVISKIKGARQGLEIIKSIRNLNQLIDNPLLYSTLGNLNLQIHNYHQALINYEKAFEYSDIDVDKKFYGGKVKICRQRLNMISRYQYHNSF